MELRGVGELHVDTAEIQGDGIDGVRFEQCELGRAADINDAAAGEIQTGVAGMNCEDRTAADEKTGAAGNWRAECAAFEGNIIAGESGDRAGRPVFLSVQRWRGGRENCKEREKCRGIERCDALAPRLVAEPGRLLQS